MRGFHGFVVHSRHPQQRQTARPPQGWRGLMLQPPLAASAPMGPAAQPLAGRSALPDELFINSIAGPYCVGEPVKAALHRQPGRHP